MRRIVLFVLTNLAVMVTLGIALRLLGVEPYLSSAGLNYTALLATAAVFGFGGAFISLLLSKPMAKWSTRARVIDGREGPTEAFVVQSVSRLAQRAGIAMPEVAIFEGAPNAFATGAFKNSALVAVSTGLLQTMSRSEVEAVLAHEVAHVANGDMQTMGLLQGVLNTFVMFLSRVVGTAVDKAVFRSEGEAPGPAYMAITLVLDLVFGIAAALVVSYFSRHREYRADWGAAELMGSARPMQAALRALATKSQAELPASVAAFGIRPSGNIGKLFSSHPPLEARIGALESFPR